MARAFGVGLAATAVTACLLATAVAATAVAATPEPHGAKGDGFADDTAGVRAALAFCAAAAPAPCTVAFARAYLSGPLRVNSSTLTLQIDGTLRMLPRAKYLKYAGGATAGPFLTNAGKLADIRVHGAGVVDGKGTPCGRASRRC